MKSERISLRLGPLAGPLRAWCDKHGKTPSEAARVAIAKMLGTKPPPMIEGRPPSQAPPSRP